MFTNLQKNKDLPGRGDELIKDTWNEDTGINFYEFVEFLCPD